MLKEREAGMKTQGLCRKQGISDATLYNWRARYGGMATSDMAKLRSLEDENRRLKKLLAERMLDNAALKDLLGKKLSSPAARFATVEPVIADHGYSERRACRPIGWIGRASSMSARAGATPPSGRGCGSWRTSVVGRLPAAGDHARARGRADEPEEGLSALSGRAADGAPAWRPQARARRKGANGGAARAEPGLEPGLYLRRLERRPALPCVGRRR
ncbi:MAG: transposase [Rhizobiales bacterium]|nr:transposase [Hyphomicrobiales bacterium]